ncbi:hypothetical protein C8Q80DRAFT_1288684 [Daedaleopsis nitida]|nr:hypothetical protein C8Q80DRAFT_1288684 [Daedaleopsis nitida]
MSPTDVRLLCYPPCWGSMISSSSLSLWGTSPMGEVATNEAVNRRITSPSTSSAGPCAAPGERCATSGEGATIYTLTVEGVLSSGELSRHIAHPRSSQYPLNLRPSPNIRDWAPVVALNKALISWGYTEHLNAYSEDLNCEFTQLLTYDVDRQAWVAQKEKGICAGDALLEQISEMLFGDFSDMMTMEEGRVWWTRLTTIAYKVMYMIIDDRL